MTQVKCRVNTCSYNKEEQCFMGTINIGGKGAYDECNTCCGSFLNSDHYSNLAEYTSMRGETDKVLCKVNTCTYYAENKCTLDAIQVGCKTEAHIYTETDCESFKNKNQ